MFLEELNIPTAKINQLKRKKIESIEDLAFFAPRKYYDFRNNITIDALINHPDEIVSVCGRITKVWHHDKVSCAYVTDGSLLNLFISCFNGYTRKELIEGKSYIFCGKAKYNSEYKRYDMTPLFFSTDKGKYQKIIPVYSKVAGMADEYLNSCIKLALGKVDVNEIEYLSKEEINYLSAYGYKDYLQALHYPADDHDLEMIKKRQIIDILYPLAEKFLEKQRMANKYKTSFVKIKSTSKMEDFIKSLPYELSKDQRSAINLMVSKMKNQDRIEALLMGDVGTGKTVVSEALAVAMAENGYQTAVMCPTSILAKQHYKEFSERLSAFGIRTLLLTSDMKMKEKRQAYCDIYIGEVDVVIGTHAIISDNIGFFNLGLTVVDEEHRFGVKQRQKLKEKAKSGIHNLSMSATPIPRSLSMGLYGPEVEIIDIKTKPAGRKEVKTHLLNNEKAVYLSIYNQIKEGHQAYIVCPLIEESDSEKMGDVESVEETVTKLTNFFKNAPEVKITAITGKMKEEEKENNINSFVNGQTNILVATTIVEVGVNVPNATVILIKNAERFGLAQLHQLRGRVGRSDLQSHCVLLSKYLDNPRLNAMVRTSDGFEIAEEDLKLRGSGDVVGVKQSGFMEELLLMAQHKDLYEKICYCINKKNPEID